MNERGTAYESPGGEQWKIGGVNGDVDGVKEEEDQEGNGDVDNGRKGGCERARGKVRACPTWQPLQPAPPKQAPSPLGVKRRMERR